HEQKGDFKEWRAAMSFEVLFKIVLIVVATFLYVISVRWVLVHQVDPRMTLSRLARKARDKVESPKDWIATREPNKIYQNGQAVGDVIGPVEKKQGRVHFAQLANTTLDLGKPFEYQRERLKIHSVGMLAGTMIDAQSKTSTRVLKDVLCERVK